VSEYGPLTRDGARMRSAPDAERRRRRTGPPDRDRGRGIRATSGPGRVPTNSRGRGQPVAAREVAPADDPLGALDGLVEATDILAEADRDGLDDRGLLEFTVAVDREITRLRAVQAAALLDVERRSAYTQDACVTTASWLRMRTRRDPRTTADRVKSALRLRHFDQLRHAYEQGEITADHVQTITRAATPPRVEAFIDAEPILVDLARTATPRELAAVCRTIADQVDRDGTDTDHLCDTGPDQRRTFNLVRTVNGLGDLSATLDPVTADRLEALLNAAHTFDPSDTPDDQKRTPTQRRHDAFDTILRAAEEHPKIPTVHGSKPRVMLTIDLMTLLGNPELACRRTKLGSGTEIDLGQALQLLHDGTFTPILMWGPYRAVGVGRTQRTLPPWLRSVLHMLHETCCGPGCDRPVAWTDAAHVHGWNEGGDTHLDRTWPGCGGHHALADVAGWKVQLDPDTRICTWTSPDGKTVLRTHPPDP
jgi:hypothetical protein